MVATPELTVATRSRRAASQIVLGAAAVLAAALLLPVEHHGHVRATVVLLLDLVVLALLARLEWSEPQLRRRSVLGVCAIVLVLAVVTPLRKSHDVYSYALLGRIVAVHHGNPYVDSPSKYADDPFYKLIAAEWRHGVTVYGPGFVAIAVGVTDIGGTSATGTRLLFQGLAALAVMAALWLVDRHTGDALAVALVGLNPMTVLYLVNGGHNDALIGLAILAAALAARRRPALAGVAIAAAALIKLVALLALVALAVWLWNRPDGRVAAVRATVASVATVVAAYLVYGRGAAVRALRGAENIISEASIWRPWRDRLVAEGRHTADIHLGTPALALVVVVAGAVILRHRRSSSPGVPMAAALFVYVAAASYTLVWYLAWLVPLVALRVRSRLALIVVAYATFALITDEHPAGPSRGWLDHLLDHADDMLRVVAVAGLVLLLLLRPGQLSEPVSSDRIAG